MTQRRGERLRAPNGSRRFVEVTVLLDPTLRDALDAYAEADGMRGRSGIVRRACREYVKRRAQRDAREVSRETL
jgi:metal-responsive CopG/Arc/MetJ family transcriptional regulator